MKSPKKVSRAPRFSRPAPVSALALLLAFSAASSPARAANIRIVDGIDIPYNICGNYTGADGPGDCGVTQWGMPDPDKLDESHTAAHSVYVGGNTTFDGSGFVAGAFTLGTGGREAMENTVAIDIASKGLTEIAGGTAISTDAGFAEATENHVYWLNGFVEIGAAGGYAQSLGDGGRATAKGNELMMSGSASSSGVYVWGGYSETGDGGASEARGNSLEISGNAEVDDKASMSGGGYAKSGDNGNAIAIGNEATLRGNAEVGKSFSGGYAYARDDGNSFAIGNKATLRDNARVSDGFFYGGYATGGKGVHAEATDNEAWILGGFVSESVYGGHADGSGGAKANENRLTIFGGTIKGGVHGGFALDYSGGAEANDNTLTISGATISGKHAAASGRAESVLGDSWALRNTIVISNNATVGFAVGGLAESSDGNVTAGDAPDTGNTVEIRSSDVDGAYGGYVIGNSGDALVMHNAVTIHDSKIVGVYGGFADVYNNGNAEVKYNTVTIRGDTRVKNLNGDIYGGCIEGNSNGDLSATYNTVTIEGAPDLAVFGLHGASIKDGGSPVATDAFTGNTLNLGTDGPLRIKSLENFAILNFTLPEGFVGDSEAYLTAENEVTLFSASGTSSKVNAIGLGSNRSAMPGSTIHLIESDANQVNVMDSSIADNPVVSTDANGITTEWKLSAMVGSNTFLDAFFKRLETPGDMAWPNGLDIKSSATEGVILKVGGTLSVGDGTLGTAFRIDDSDKGGVTVDIGRLDAEAGNVMLSFAGDIAAWNGADGVRFRNLTLGGGHAFTQLGSGAYRVDAYEVNGAATFDATPGNGLLDATGATLRFNALAMNDGETMLTVKGDIDITGASIQIPDIDGNSSLAQGHRVILADTSLSLTGDFTGDGRVSARGLFVEYDGLVSLDRAEGRLLFDVLGARATKESESLPDGPIAGGALISGGGDFIAGQGLQAARDQGTQAVRGGMEASPYRPRIFATLGGSQLRHDADSRIDVDGHVLVAGSATGIATDSGDATVGVFIESGEGDYTSRNASGKGKGTTRYHGGGLLGRLDTAGDVYLEGSLRGGVVRTGYRGGAQVQNARYDTRSAYLGAHLGAGRTWALDERDSLDTYAQLLWTRQGKDSVTLSQGQRFAVDAIDSRRLKIGTRLNHVFSDKATGFAGLAYDHEFSGKVRSTVNGQKISVSGIEGGSVVIEAGLTGRPTKSQPLYFDFGIQGHAGKREGVTAHVRMNYFF